MSLKINNYWKINSTKGMAKLLRPHTKKPAISGYDTGSLQII